MRGQLRIIGSVAALNTRQDITPSTNTAHVRRF
jgi:hypothetical protein